MNKTIEIIKKGGIIAITAVLAYIIYVVISGYQTTINNHIEHNGDYLQENTKVLVELKGAVEANTVQTTRLEQLLDLKL